MLRHCIIAIACAFVTCPTLSKNPVHAEEPKCVAFLEDASTFTVIRDGRPYLDVTLVGWGANWSWLGFQGKIEARNGQTFFANTARLGNATLQIHGTATQSATNRIELRYELTASEEVELTSVVAAIDFAEAGFQGGAIEVPDTTGKPTTVAFPLAKKGIGNHVGQFTVRDADNRATRIRLEPACNAPSDGALRITLAERVLPRNTMKTLTMTIELPEPVKFFASETQVPYEPGFEHWYAFEPEGEAGGRSELSMSDWLDAPAGRHGRIVRNGDKLLYHDKPIKLWGINLCYEACAPDKELAEKRAAFYASYGINAVRLHKYADGHGWAGIQSRDSFVEFDPQGLDRMDYFVSQLRRHGIYVEFSAHFGSQKLGEGDKRLVPYLEEFGKLGQREGRVETPHSAVHYARELQDLQIQQMVNLLRHKNPYTGNTYAQENALAFIEIINEQSILFYSSMAPLKTSPTLRHRIAGQFSDWLRARYGNQQQLEKAWGGSRAFDSFVSEGFDAVGENLDKKNILPLGNPWFWDPDQLNGSQSFRKRRLLDTLEFLYGLQNAFYSRYAEAVRDAGYQGEIVSSNWQAGRALSHFYNLHSDALVGAVDRHNYFAGGRGQRIDNSTMLCAPGSGMLSSGMQQVLGHPFMLSEWIHVTPNEWGVEGPAILGAYGMGLQGWDVSFIFQNRDRAAFSEQLGRDRWDVTAPQVLGVFPAVARQVLRGDVMESDLVAPCNVHVPSMADGKLGFEDRVEQQYDVKSFSTDKVHAAALAVARCGVEFTDRYRETPTFDVSKHVRDGFCCSSTNQLRWKAGNSRLDGFFTINTPATKAVVGFADGQTCELDDITIHPQCRYAAIYVTAKEPDRDIKTSNRLLVVAIARARNSGMKVLHDDRILKAGTAPIVMEPVKARIQVARSGSPTVHLLDHSGNRTARTLPVNAGAVEIDGARDKTCYYLISYE